MSPESLPLLERGIIKEHRSRNEAGIIEFVVKEPGREAAFLPTVLKPGETIVEIHLKKLDDEQKKQARSLLRDSFRLLCQNLQQSNTRPVYIVGKTYEALAELAKNFGFDIEEYEPSFFEKPKIKYSYRLTQAYEKGKPMGKVFLIYDDYQAFQKRFSETQNE